MGPSILIAEDDLAFRDTLEDVLVEEGYEVATARNGSEAIAVLHLLSRPALILLDLHMPLMDGIQFLHHLEQRPDREGYEVVIMSALVDVQYFDHAPGVIKALKKPFDVDEILTVVKEFNRRRYFGRKQPSNENGGELAG
jgi:CheY-like chemotaxis protein